MAIFTPSSTISEIRGSIGENMYSRNHYKPYIKPRKAPRFDGTDAQLQFNDALRTAVAGWQSTSEAVRQNWNNYAEKFTTRPRLGYRSKMNGYNLWVKAVMLMSTIGLSVPGAPTEPEQFPIVTNALVTCEGGILLVTLELSYYSERWYSEWWFSAPASPGTMSINSVNRKFIDRSVMDAARIDFDLSDIYQGRFGISFGDFPGDKIWFEYKLINPFTAQQLTVFRGYVFNNP